MTESIAGLRDESLPKEDNAKLRQILADHTSQEVQFHAFRTVVAPHILVPGGWTIKRGHSALEDLVR